MFLHYTSHERSQLERQLNSVPMLLHVYTLTVLPLVGESPYSRGIWLSVGCRGNLRGKCNFNQITLYRSILCIAGAIYDGGALLTISR